MNSGEWYFWLSGLFVGFGVGVIVELLFLYCLYKKNRKESRGQIFVR